MGNAVGFKEIEDISNKMNLLEDVGFGNELIQYKEFNALSNGDHYTADIHYLKS
jgi:hypothetical protein